MHVCGGGAERCVEAVFGDIDVVGLDANEAERAVVDAVDNTINGVIKLRQVGRGCIYAVPGIADGRDVGGCIIEEQVTGTVPKSQGVVAQ